MKEDVLYDIFLDLHKVYDALDRYKLLNILEWGGVGPQACRILQYYWYSLKMVSHIGGYYGAALQVF